MSPVPAIARVADIINAEAELCSCRILVVDGSQLEREQIATILKFSGFWNLEFAGDGATAVQLIPRFQPDLVILPAKMAGLSGLQLCRQLRAAAATADLPVLVTAAISDQTSRSAAYQVGASDFLTKPLHGDELIARTRAHLHRQVVMRGLRNSVRQMEEDFEVARGMQVALLPSAASLQSIAAATGVAVGAYFHPSAMLGGDIWGVSDLGDGRIGVYVADFAGHGVSAALNTFRLHTLVQELQPLQNSPDRLLHEMNARLAALLPVGQFATMLFGIIDTAADRFCYAAAGTPTPLLWDPTGSDIIGLDAAGIPLGITDDARYEKRNAAMPPGAGLVIFSDGLFDPCRHDGSAAGEAAVAAAARRLLGVSDPTEFVNALSLELLGASEQPPADDITIVCLRR